MGATGSSFASPKSPVERFASPNHDYGVGWEPAPGDVFRFKITQGDSAGESYHHGYLLIKPNGYAYLDEFKGTMFVKRGQNISYIEGNAIFQVCSREEEISGHYLSMSTFGFSYPAGVWPKEAQKTVFQLDKIEQIDEPADGSDGEVQGFADGSVEGLYTLSIGKEEERKLCIADYGVLNFCIGGKTVEVRFEPVKMNEAAAKFDENSCINHIGTAVTHVGGVGATGMLGYLAAHGMAGTASGGAIGFVAAYGLFLHMCKSPRKRPLSDLLHYQKENNFGGPGFNVGVVGPRGSGKSTFVNAMRHYHEGMENVDLAISSTGEEGTQFPEGYEMSFVDGVSANSFFGVKERVFTIWDLPGYGTPNHPSKTYIDNQALKNFDCIILIEDEYIHDCTLEVYHTLAQAEVKLFVVRNKFDNELRELYKKMARMSRSNNKFAKSKSEISNEHAVKIRNNYNAKLFENDNVYLISSDFADKLNKMKSPDFAKLWKHVFLSCLENRQVPPPKVLECFCDQKHQDFWPQIVSTFYKKTFREDYKSEFSVDLGL